MNKWMSLFTSSDYRQVDSYTASLGFPIPAPQVYRPHSILEPYLKLGANLSDSKQRIIFPDGHSHMSAPPVAFRQGIGWLFS